MGKYGPTASKLKATTFSGAVVLVGVFILGRLGVEVPPEVALGGATIIQHIVGWLTPEKALR